MRKYAETLVKYVGNKSFKRCGNHEVTIVWPSCDYATYLDDKTNRAITIKPVTRFFTYHENVICIVNDNTKNFWLSHAGWFTSSTTQALNQYREWFSRLGYKCMTD